MSVGVRERSAAEHVALGPALRDAAAHEQRPWMAASVARGPALVLGALQRAGRVVDLEAASRDGIPVLRRATTGTAAFVGPRAVWVTIALPHVAALVPDATPRTLVNRNVRGILRGLTSLGARAGYFGREWIAVEKAPAAVLGYDVTEAGVVLLDVIASWNEPIAVPAELAATEERAIDRWAGKTPVRLCELLRDRNPGEVAERVLEAIAAYAGVERIAGEEPSELAEAAPIVDPRDPVPEGYEVLAPVRVPIGWIDRGRRGDAVWLGGDVLVAAHAMRGIAEAAARGQDATPWIEKSPLEGATLHDLVEAARGV